MGLLADIYRGKVDLSEAGQQALVERAIRLVGDGSAEGLRSLLSAHPWLSRARWTRGDGYALLHYAANDPVIVRLLLRHGANPNDNLNVERATPLHEAAGFLCVASVRALLEAGAEPGRVDANGETPVERAYWEPAHGVERHKARRSVLSALGDLPGTAPRTRREPLTYREKREQYEQRLQARTTR